MGNLWTFLLGIGLLCRICHFVRSTVLDLLVLFVVALHDLLSFSCLPIPLTFACMLLLTIVSSHHDRHTEQIVLGVHPVLLYF